MYRSRASKSDYSLDTKYIRERDINLTIKYIKKIQSFSDKNNIELFVTFLPHQEMFHFKKENFDKFSIQKKIEKILHKNNIKYISSSNTFFNLGKEATNDKYWRDDIHPTRLGNKIIALDIIEELKIIIYHFKIIQFKKL